jgi:D-alanine---D-serine ligase
MEKLKVAILFGGCSPEHEVSLASAYSVIMHMDREKYEPVLLGITRSGQWYHFLGAPEEIRDDTWHQSGDCVRAILSPDRETRGVLVFETDRVRSIRLDAAMPVLHGKNGEDGTVQGLLELAGVPIVGCRALASALCMDKNRAHQIAGGAGVRVPRSFVLKDQAELFDQQAEKLGYPLFVKPVNAGSSYGITKVFHQQELPAAVKLAFAYDSEVIVEEAIPGFEIGCAILGNDDLTVGVPDEIELADGFFDYKEKYTLETSAIHVPARIPERMIKEAKETAKVIYRALGCSGFARVDMFITPAGEIVFNEVNTIPGFTAHSRYPNMLKAAGMTFEQVLDSVIDLAVKP